MTSPKKDYEANMELIKHKRMNIDSYLAHTPEELIGMASRASRTASYFSQTMGPAALRAAAQSKMSTAPKPLLENGLGNVLKVHNK